MAEEENNIEETMEEHILRRLKSLENSVSRLSCEVRMYGSTDMSSGEKKVYLKGRVDDLEKEIRLLTEKPSL